MRSRFIFQSCQDCTALKLVSYLLSKVKEELLGRGGVPTSDPILVSPGTDFLGEDIPPLIYFSDGKTIVSELCSYLDRLKRAF